MVSRLKRKPDLFRTLSLPKDYGGGSNTVELGDGITAKRIIDSAGRQGLDVTAPEGITRHEAPFVTGVATYLRDLCGIKIEISNRSRAGSTPLEILNSREDTYVELEELGISNGDTVRIVPFGKVAAGSLDASAQTMARLITRKGLWKFGEEGEDGISPLRTTLDEVVSIHESLTPELEDFDGFRGRKIKDRRTQNPGFEVPVLNIKGIHMRPSTNIFQIANFVRSKLGITFRLHNRDRPQISPVKVGSDNEHEILAVQGLGATPGNIVRIVPFGDKPHSVLEKAAACMAKVVGYRDLEGFIDERKGVTPMAQILKEVMSIPKESK